VTEGPTAAIPTSLRSLVLFVLLCSACSRGEARSLIEAVDRFRKAPTEQQPPLADALEKVPCSDDEVCAAKDACVKSASATAKGIRKKQEVEQVLAEVLDGSLAKTDPRATKSFVELDESDRLRKEGNDALTACDEKITALRMKSH
jgi:hypothetical protein